MLLVGAGERCQPSVALVLDPTYAEDPHRCAKVTDIYIARFPESEGEPDVQKHRIRSGKQTITVTVPQKPARAGIDPRYLLNDWETDDNIEAVKIGS